jgi:hypothetical protein
MFPFSVDGTCGGFADPLGHCNARDATAPVAADDRVPSILKDTTHPLGIPLPEDADVHAADLPLLEVTPTLEEVLK